MNVFFNHFYSPSDKQWPESCCHSSNFWVIKSSIPFSMAPKCLLRINRILRHPWNWGESGGFLTPREGWQSELCCIVTQQDFSQNVPAVDLSKYFPWFYNHYVHSRGKINDFLDVMSIQEILQKAWYWTYISKS